MRSKAQLVGTTDVIARFTTCRGVARCRPGTTAMPARPLCRFCRDRMDPHTKKVLRKRVVIFSPPILTALQAGACAHLSTACETSIHRGVEKMRRLACDWGLARRWRICHARHARPAYCHCRRRHQLGIAPPPACSCAAKDARRRAAAPPPRNGDALLATPQSVMTCGTKREVSRVIGPSSSRMPRPAGRSATTQLPTNAWRPSNTGSG